ncbi:LOB domain-containing protein 24-like [Lycium barbarum]|uniref:LOB domain-containing protein 24-like n=1 Tax=Lycium barbarum TaxID=112863 RepID=UPI00293EC90D|nr:LOB domain-containing protein 24-like [Lycium barbarum]
MNADMLMFVAACAACKHLGEKCDANCQLAPYFPSNATAEDFQNVYQIFEVDNIIKLLNSVPDDQKEKTAETLILEAKIRKENPVHGCLAIERKLRAEIEAHEKELEMIQNHISLCKKMATLQMEEQQSEEELDRSSLALVSPSDAHFSMPGSGCFSDIETHFGVADFPLSGASLGIARKPTAIRRCS